MYPQIDYHKQTIKKDTLVLLMLRVVLGAGQVCSFTAVIQSIEGNDITSSSNVPSVVVLHVSWF